MSTLFTSQLSGTLAAAQFPALTGDVTTSAGSIATTVGANKITYAKMQQGSAGILLGNATGAAANLAEITLGIGLTFIGSTLNAAPIIAKYALTSNFANTTPTATVLTATANGVLTVDGQATALGDVLLLAAQTNPQENGVYIVSTAGASGAKAVLTRVTLLNAWAQAALCPEVAVVLGTAWAGTMWGIYAAPSGTLGTTAIRAICIGQPGTTVSSNGIGYAAGSGGAVAQATSRTTGVTLNKSTGVLTLFSTTATAGQVTTFTVTNSLVTATDVINVSVGTATGIYLVFVTKVQNGSFNISVYTPAAVGSAEAPTINFAVMKAVNA